MSLIPWEWRGQISYAQAWAEQRQRRAAIIAHQAEEVIWLLEHPTGVITTGRRPIASLPTRAQLPPRIGCTKQNEAAWRPGMAQASSWPI